MQHTNLGYELMNRIKDDTVSLGKVEIKPKFEGRQIIMIIHPL
jgi:translation initiation factor IF-3